MQSIELMNRLHALDAALADCQQRAIDVDELCVVWERQLAGIKCQPGAQEPWVDALLYRVAVRHGIAAMVKVPPVPDDVVVPGRPAAPAGAGGVA